MITTRSEESVREFLDSAVTPVRDFNMKLASDGRLFVGHKTSYDNTNQTQIGLLVRSAAGAWSALHRIWTRGEMNGTRPLVMLDEGANRVYVFASPNNANAAPSPAQPHANIHDQHARLALADQRQAVAHDVRRAWLTLESTRQQLTVALAQQKAADLAVSTTQARYQVGTSTLLELTQARASQLQANVAVVNARNALAFQDALLPYYTGELDPAKALL